MIDSLLTILGNIIPFRLLFLYMPNEAFIFVFMTFILIIISLLGLLASLVIKNYTYKKILVNLLKSTILFMWASFIISFYYYSNYVAKYGISQIHTHKPAIYLLGIVIANILIYLYVENFRENKQ